MNGIAFDSSTQSLWITGKEWPVMYNVTFLEPEAPSEPEPEPEPESGEPSSTDDNFVYSNVILAIMLATVVILLAMNLKDGGHNPPDEGASE